MRKAIGFLFGIFIAAALSAQTPDAFNYQAVARDASGEPLLNTNISVRISILPGSVASTAIYMESFSLVTNDFGLFTIEVGKGVAILGDFALIDWGAGDYFLKIELALDDGSSFFIVGTSQLLSVPYALHAKNADNTFSGSYEDLTDAPNWADSIMQYTSGTIVPEGIVESGNLLTYDGNNWVSKDIVMANTGVGEPVSIMQPYLVINYCIALVGIYPSRNVEEPFIGAIMAFGFNFAPRGWAACDGQLLAISQHDALFSLLGTHYGGDGRTSFGLPDLRGRTLIHQGTGPGLTQRIIGQKQGSETITIPLNALPPHKHIITFE